MRQLSPSGQHAVNDIAQRHGFSPDAVMSMLESVINGNGGMAQFNHPEFSGSGQWMRGGMTMVSDMFNNHLKGRVDSLCFELANLVAQQPDLVRSGSFQSQSQGNQGQGNQSQGNQSQGNQSQGNSGYGGQQQSNHGWNSGQQQSQNGNGPNGPVSLFVPPAPGTSGDWWPADLRWPNSTGAQNGVRYAHFAQARRLAIEVNGQVTVYDTLDHQIGGFSQQQGHGGSLSFSSQYGLVDVASLPVVSGAGGNRPAPQQHHNPAPAYNAAPSAGGEDVFATIEKLAQLRDKGFLSEDEFAAKKVELLSRL